MQVVVLNGSINSGKTTTGRALAAILPGAEFIDGDDHGISSAVPFAEMIERAQLWLLDRIAAVTAPFLVIAYPLRDSDFARMQAACAARGASLFAATLAPPLDMALSNRGARVLDAWERNRVAEMYAEGYAARSFSDVIITDVTTPEVTASTLARLIARG
ncbi:MAG TPA: shikimate kinase [Devosia sp.]|nr:shikimate kinase [Devosia sp.]